MSRKKWRLQLIPDFRYVNAPSKVQAYRTVDGYRARYASGWRTHQVDVEVDEGDGWALYERIVFPEREATP